VGVEWEWSRSERRSGGGVEWLLDAWIHGVQPSDIGGIATPATATPTPAAAATTPTTATAILAVTVAAAFSLSGFFFCRSSIMSLSISS